MTLIPSVTFTNYEWFPWSICKGYGMPAGNAYPSGHLIPSPIVGPACAPIVETRFLELAMTLLDFSPRIPLGTFSILLTCICMFYFLFQKVIGVLHFEFLHKKYFLTEHFIYKYRVAFKGIFRVLHYFSI